MSTWCPPEHWPFAARLLALQGRCGRQLVHYQTIANHFTPDRWHWREQLGVEAVHANVFRVKRNWRRFSA